MTLRARHWLVALLLAALLQLTLAAVFYRPHPLQGSSDETGVEIALGSMSAGVKGADRGQSETNDITHQKHLPGPTDQTPLTDMAEPSRIETEASTLTTTTETDKTTTAPARADALAAPASTSLKQAKVKPDRADSKLNKPAKESTHSLARNKQPIPPKVSGPMPDSRHTEATGKAPGESANGASATSMAGSGPGSTSGSAGQTAGDEVSSEYYYKITAWLEKHKHYPQRAIQRRQQGVVKVYFRIDRHGNLLSREIIASSGYPLLDEAADALLLRASPMPGFPRQSTAQELEFSVPIKYALR